MKSLKNALLTTPLLLLVLGSPTVLAQEGAATELPPAAGAESLVQLAVLLDSSSSMGGLIRQAQTQLWQIVNEFALAKGDGGTVKMQVALYEYGKNTLPEADRYIRKIVPLTANLDRVSEELFSLKANTIPGGSEYCGAVIQAAVQELEWSTSKDALKVIFVAGNEPFTQGPVDYRKACEAAVRNAIVVNTVHCGAHQTGVSQKWQDGARLGEGLYLSINQDKTTVYRPTTEDKEIVRLGKELNKTYVPFGEQGNEGLRRQRGVDEAARESGAEADAERSISKGSELYKNPEWDLVDAVEAGEVKLEEVEEKALPKEMRGLELNEKKKLIEEKAKARKELQTKIAKLGQARKAQLERPAAKPAAANAASAAKAQDKSLGDALVEALRKQSAEKGIQLRKPEKPPVDKEKEGEKEAEKEKSQATPEEPSPPAPKPSKKV